MDNLDNISRAHIPNYKGKKKKHFYDTQSNSSNNDLEYAKFIFG